MVTPPVPSVTGMQPQMASKKNPPKFAIANGFVIGSLQQVIKFFNKEGQRVTRKVENDELTDILKTMVAPLRPYGCVFAYSGGAQKSREANISSLRWIKTELRE